MHKTTFANLSVIQFDIFRKETGIRHGITTKEGWKTGNKPRFTEEGNSDCTAYRKELSSAIGIDPEQIQFPKQVHSDFIAVVGDIVCSEEFAGFDALITNRSEICLAIQTADCVPVLLFDPTDHVIAAVHAGWRGTMSKVVLKTVLKMVDQFGCKPENMIAGIGPSINKYAYEVGEEVIEKVIDNFSNYQSLLIPSMKDGKAYFDLWEANKTLLLESGIKIENIEVLGMCTYELDQLFFSARRDGVNTGRVVSYIMMNKK